MTEVIGSGAVCSCHPEPPAFGERGIWARRANSARSSRGTKRASGALPYWGILHHYQVITYLKRWSAWACLTTCLLGTAFAQQDQQLPAASSNVSLPEQERPERAAEHLYLQLRAAGLDPAKVYKILEAPLDRDRVHITLEDGTIAFTSEVSGRITGAFFEGRGEVLVMPPNEGERASMTLFTEAAVLEEPFTTAYFRFNDDTFSELQPYFRPPDEDPGAFAQKWNGVAHNLAEWDALRLFMSFSCYLPTSDPGSPGCIKTAPDRFLHARVQGAKLGAFDVYYDSEASEPFVVAQQKTAEGANYYNVWTSFASPVPRSQVKSNEKIDELVIRSYRIRAQVQPPTTLKAETRLQVEVTRGGERALVFELSRYLKVSSVKMGNQELELIQNQALEGTALARRGNDILAVVFPRTLRTGDKFELTFNYGGDVLSEAGGGLLYVGARGTWYPNRGFAMADFDLQFRYPQGWTLLATGKAVAPDVESGLATSTEQVSRWQTEQPIPVAGFNLGKYVKASAKAGDAIVETYAAAAMERSFPKTGQAVALPDIPSAVPRDPRVVVVPQPPPSPARHAQSVADDAARAIDFYAENFGPFPYGTLKLTQMPGPLSQGWPGLIFLSSYAFLTPEEKAHLHMDEATALLDDCVTAHETAHQWWGDLVFWKGYRDQWIFEALASYTSLMMLERRDPAGFRLVLEKYRAELEKENKSGAMLKDAGPVTAGFRLSSSEFPEGYEAISYGRGTWLFHMLRYMLKYGEMADARSEKSAPDSNQIDPLVRALRKVRQRYAGKSITTRELVDIFAEDLPMSLRYEGKKNLDWFYDGWVNGTAMPRIDAKNIKFVPRGNNLQVTGVITQKDASKTLVTAVPVFGLNSKGTRSFLGIAFADGPENSFKLIAPPDTKRILLDPDQILLTQGR